MKILLLAPLITDEMKKQRQVAGGMHTWTVAYLNGLISKNHQVSLVNTIFKGKRYLGDTKISLKDECLRTFYILKNLNIQLKTNTFNIAHICSNAGTFGIIRDFYCTKRIRNKRVKIVLHFHCNLDDWVKKKYSYYCLKKMAGYADKIFVLNSSSQRFLLDLIPTLDVEIIPNFLPDTYSIQKKHEINKMIHKILYVGQLRISKGCAIINDTAKHFPEKTFYLIGSMYEECQNIEFAPNVILTGNVEPAIVRKYMTESDILLFPTFTEGFPLVILEAMSCGMPIISTPVGAIPDMIEEKGGILVPPKDLNAVILAVKTLEDVELRKSMSEWNINKMISSYSSEKTEQKILAVYHQLQKSTR